MINKRLLPWFTLAVLLVIAVGIAAYTSLKKQIADEVDITQAYKVIDQTSKISGLLMNMQAIRQAYQSSGDRAYLDKYAGLQSDAVTATDSIAIANSTDRQSAQLLKADIQMLNLFWETRVTQNIKFDQSSFRREKELVDAVQNRLRNISLSAGKLLEERQQAKNNGIEQAILIIAVGTVLILLVILGLIRLVIAEHTNRTKAELLLNEKYAELNQVNEVTNTANLLLDGLRQMNDSLMGNDSVTELVMSCLETLTTYLKVPCAVCYLFDNQQNELIQTGAVALAPGMKERIKPGEGITGAAIKRKTLTVINEIPGDYWQIGSASGSAIPDTLVILPLWKGNELIGAIEMGCFGKDVSDAVELLNGMAANIALGLSAAQLLALTQQQRDALAVQQEELRQSNDELSVQAEELRASEEGLKEQEAELIRMNIELEEKTEGLELARMEALKKAEDLELAGKYKSEFLANMSHELRTPLNSILILTALMQENKDKNLSHKQQENLGIVYKSGTDLLNLINDILDLSKIEAGKADFNFEQVSIRGLAEDMHQAFAHVATNKQINFRVTNTLLTAEYVTTDRQRLGQVIKNLLSNAFKFTPNKGSVDLSFSSVDEALRITVTDTGVGIPKEKKELVFEAFRQADGATTRRYGGTGLGLSISRELVSKLGGTITLQSTEGKGSTFIVQLPLQQVVLTENTASAGTVTEYIAPVALPIHEQTQIDDSRAGIIRNERAILIIEDDVNFARAVNDYAVQRGFKTIIALSGDEGLHYASKYSPAAIILDLALPVLSGQHILKSLKAEPALQHIPVHVISAHDGFDLPARDVAGYVQKPVKQHDLEYTFSSIETYISQHYRKALILCDNSAALKQLFENATARGLPGIVYDITASREQALQMIKAGLADCLIVDCSAPIAEEAETLKVFREAAAGHLYVIAYANRDLNNDEIKQLKAVSNAIIGPSAQANNRLFDEIELFLKKVDDTGAIQSPQKISASFTSALQGQTVLIADDDMRNIFALSALLEAQDMVVLTAEHGKEAIEMLHQHPETAIVLMDVMMPEMDGYEAMQLIRTDDKYARLPIIALTAKAMVGDREKCLAAGASDYITKPVDNQKLLALLRVWLAADK
ncbi:response regulator [Mucilaginibacter celer]|uniref:histidine kinase n=1 Tax=Mucilaginibacter celer TaxID=2305508 RepID=A0A494VS40_9SPHI|nr:response regulator [Mucilaginibacter celer]AYL98416.1 response regulator [Mucilaginibacter celer]